MTEIELVQKFYEHLATGDRQGAYSLLSDDFILKQAGSLPYGGEYVGVSGLNDFFKKFSTFWKEFKTLHTDYYLSENKVFAISKIRGVLLKTEKIIETEMIQVYVIDNQKLTSAQPFYFDTKILTEE
jgi:ketosteroid isomerase-like protein